MHHANNEQYNLSTKRLKITYELMMDELYKTFDRYSKGKIKNRKRNPYYFEDKDDDFDEYADWYDCNTVDRMDGSKYIGYLAREYEGSRYGSYPVHDDYSEEAWADDNPWE